MIDSFIQQIESLKNKEYIKQQTIKKFLKRLAVDTTITKEENPLEHFCSFFLPFDKESQTVFLGHHIIANDWIPPGGHLEKGENPIDAVYREFKEELGYTLKNECVVLFDISIIPVRKSKRPCKIHYDFWHVVYMAKRNFIFNKSEFYNAQWLTKENALARMQRDAYKTIVETLFTHY